MPPQPDLSRPTPLLRWGGALLKLDQLMPSGSTAGRAASLWDFRGAGPAVIAASGNAALAAAQWARFHGVQLAVVPRGVYTHEMREGLKLWGATLDPSLAPTLAALDSDAAAPLFAQGLGAELLAELPSAPALLVVPGAERAALLGALRALQEKWPGMRGVALVAADEELPDLPREVDLPQGIERVAVTRAQAAQARRRLARELGLLASHAGAAAAVHAHERSGLALLTAPGEREFSIESAP